MASDKETLLGMGFDPQRVEWALKATQNRGLQPAMDHLLEHEGEPIPDLSAPISSSAVTSSRAGEVMEEDDEDAEALRAVYGTGAAGIAAAAADVEAKSIKCSQCGKIFKNTALANFHAEKSGHDQFEESTEEIKPLTEEEKTQKLAELRAKLAEKRAVKAAQEAQENKANEALRRKAGKDTGKVREDMKAKETIKAAEQARRDKIEDAKAKAAIRAQIEADKRTRAEKAAREKALREGRPVPEAGSTPTPAPAPAHAASTAASSASRDHKETRLQIRLASGGQPYTTTLSSEATLHDVADYLAAQNAPVDAETISFSLTFPRKQFAREEFTKTLKQLGLTPSAVLIAS